MREILFLIGAWALVCSASAQAAAPEQETIVRIQALYDEPDPAQRAWLEQWLDYPSSVDSSFAERRAGHAPDRLAVATLAQAALEQLDVMQRRQQLQAGSAVRPPVETASATEIQAWLSWLRASPSMPAQVLAAGPEHAWPEPLLRHLALRLDQPAWRHAWLRRAHTAASLRQIQQQIVGFSHADIDALSQNPALASHAWQTWAKRAAAGDKQAVVALKQAWQAQDNLAAIAAGLAAWPPAVAQARRWHKSEAPGSTSHTLAALVLIHAQPAATGAD